MLFHDGLDVCDSFEGAIAEVAGSVGGPCLGDIAEATCFRCLRKGFGGVFSGEKTAGDGVVDDDVEAVASAGDEEFLFDVACCEAVLVI